MGFYKDHKIEILVGVVVAAITWGVSQAWSGTRGQLDDYNRHEIANQLKQDSAFRETIVADLKGSVETEFQDLDDVRKEFKSSRIRKRVDGLYDSLTTSVDATYEMMGRIENEIAFDHDANAKPSFVAAKTRLAKTKEELENRLPDMGFNY